VRQVQVPLRLARLLPFAWRRLAKTTPEMTPFFTREIVNRPAVAT
jgi:hypothetical protein